MSIILQLKLKAVRQMAICLKQFLLLPTPCPPDVLSCVSHFPKSLCGEFGKQIGVKKKITTINNASI